MSISFIRRITTRSLVFTYCSLPIACGSPNGSANDVASTGNSESNATQGTTSSTTGGITSSTTGGTGEPIDGCDAEHTMLAPSDGWITDFADESSSSSSLNLGFLAYPLGDEAAPTGEVREGVWHLSVDAPKKADPQYVGVLIGFTDACLDAKDFEGVEFSIGGSLSGCTLLFGAGDAAHQDAESGAPVAEGPPGSYQPMAWIADHMDSAEDQTLRVPFQNQSEGSPSSPLDTSELIFTLWQFDVPAGTSDDACAADLRIDDVRFYRADD